MIVHPVGVVLVLLYAAYPVQCFWKVLDIVMKNCGEDVHTEVITESFMEQIKEIVKVGLVTPSSLQNLSS